MNLLRKIYYALSPQMRFLARRIYYFPIDCFDGITGKRDRLTPPKGLIFIGSGDFREQGERLLGILRQYGAVTPQSHILDVAAALDDWLYHSPAFSTAVAGTTVSTL